MSILTRIRAAVKALSGAQLVMEPHFRQISFSQFTQEELDADLIKHFVHWVYVCSTKNAAGMASVPLRLYVTTGAAESKRYRYLRKGIDTRSVNKARLAEMEKHNPLLAQRISKTVEVEEVTQHPFLELWSAVNPFMNGFEMIELLDIYQELTGDAFLYLPPTPLGIPQELWILQNQYVTVVPDKKNFIKGYLYGSNKHNAKALAPDEVIHFKFPNPHSIFNGFSPVQGGISAITRKEDMDAYEHSLLQNNARPDFLILAKKKMSDKDKLALREQWQELYGSKRGRGRPALLNTDASIETLGFSPRDMAFVQGQQHSKEEICSTFGVPVSKVTPNAKYANAEVGDREWKSDTIRPRLRRMADKLNEKLLVRYDGRLFVAFDDPVPEDREFKLREQESDLEHGVIVINDVRAEKGKDPVSWGRVPILPFNMIPFGSAPPEPAVVVAPEEASMKTGTVQKVRRPPMTRIPEMARIMRRIFRGMEAEVLRNLSEGKALTKQEETFYWMFDTEAWTLETAELMGPPIRAQLVTGAQYGLDRLGTGLRFDVMNPEVRRWLETYVAKFSNKVMQQSAADLSKTLLQGIEQGETIFELRKRTEEVFGRMKIHKSEMIARSESSRASHQGMLQGWKDSGVVTAKVWQIQPGACQFCEPMQGKVVELERSFFEQGSVAPGNQGGNLKLDYEIVEGPPLHPNCLIGETPILAPDLQAGFVAQYDGPVIRIVLASGRKITATVNHMFLTPRGFCSAALLREGDDVLYYPTFDSCIVAPNNQRQPSSIQKIITALTESSCACTTTKPARRNDLHGDAAFVDGNIDIISTNRFLLSNSKPDSSQVSDQSSFVLADTTKVGLACNSELAPMLLSMRAAVGAPQGRQPSDCFLRRAHHIPQFAGVASASKLNPRSTEPAHYSSAAESKLIGDVIRRHPSLIQTCKIVHLTTLPYSGPVYDLETTSSLYVANGVLSSNCICTLTAVVKE